MDIRLVRVSTGYSFVTTRSWSAYVPDKVNLGAPEWEEVYSAYLEHCARLSVEPEDFESIIDRFQDL